MAVHDRRYRGYDGPITPIGTRWRVLPRYAWGNVFASRIFVGFFTLCFVGPLFALAWVYFVHNVKALAQLGLDSSHFAPIDPHFFAGLLGIQAFALGGFMTVVVAPGLVSPDLTNGALPLIFARPITRAGYTLGKFAVLATLLSLITWMPALLIFGVQSWFEGWRWFAENAWLAGAIVAGSGIWITTISLLAIAMSALAKKKIVGQTFLLGVIIFGGVAGDTINTIFGTSLGYVFNLPELMHSVWEGLFRVPLNAKLPAPVAWVALLVVCGLSIAVLARKLRPVEVVT